MAGAAGLLAACAPATTRAAAPPRVAPPTTGAPPTPGPTTVPAPTVPTSTAPLVPVRTTPEVFTTGPPGSVQARQVAITIDDGYCAGCVQAYVELAQVSGMHLTFNPNGRYGSVWAPLAPVLAPLVEAGQVQIANHTFDHHWLTRLGAAEVRAQIERNDEWVQQTFNTSARPWWRPPYGAHDERVDALVAETGYTNVLMWDGSYGDSLALTPQVLMAQADRYLHPGVIMLGHANHPTVTQLFGQISDLIASRGLQPVTVDEMFGTRRPGTVG